METITKTKHSRVEIHTSQRRSLRLDTGEGSDAKDIKNVVGDNSQGITINEKKEERSFSTKLTSTCLYGWSAALLNKAIFYNLFIANNK